MQTSFATATRTTSTPRPATGSSARAPSVIAAPPGPTTTAVTSTWQRSTRASPIRRTDLSGYFHSSGAVYFGNNSIHRSRSLDPYLPKSAGLEELRSPINPFLRAKLLWYTCTFQSKKTLNSHTHVDCFVLQRPHFRVRWTSKKRWSMPAKDQRAHLIAPS